MTARPLFSGASSCFAHTRLSSDRCPGGWTNDRFGLSWQIVPNILGELMQDKDPVKAKRVMDALLQMT